MLNGMKTHSLIVALTGASLALAFATFCPAPLAGQSSSPQYEVDPSWPKPLPDTWVIGRPGGICIDAQDHVFVANRRDLTDNDLEAGEQAPSVMEFDPEGNVVNSWGDPNILPHSLHSCTVDYQNNVWIGGDLDGIVQKYSHDGKLLLQIGTRGVLDTSDGTLEGRALNSSHTLLARPASIAVDPGNGDVYVADGYGNDRVVVFDRTGKYLRQWGRQGSKAEAEAGVGGAFMQVVHCVVMGNDGLIYVCDRQGDRIQVFDKMGNFQRNIWVRASNERLPDASGTDLWLAFSRDPEQRFMYVANEHHDQITILDHATGQVVGSFGRVGHQIGELTHPHTLAIDSKGNVYVAEVQWGRRIQKFKIVGGH
jgi:DNA-binding beta-propeller fold protein YncE